MAENRSKKPIKIFRIDGERGNLLAIAQAEMGPCAARIGGAIGALPAGKTGPVQALPAGM